MSARLNDFWGEYHPKLCTINPRYAQTSMIYFSTTIYPSHIIIDRDGVVTDWKNQTTLKHHHSAGIFICTRVYTATVS